MHRRTLVAGVVFSLLVSLGFSLPRAAAGEPIRVPETFGEQTKSWPKGWRGKEFKITVESIPSGPDGTPRLRLAKSSGDKRADRIAIAYAAYLLQAKPDLRAQNKTSILTFPMVIDGGMKGGAPRKAIHQHAGLNKPKGGFKDRSASRFPTVRTP
ncbi:hypothetical protein AYO41_03815 [Verrucomicrobia bacterium SCGC AG-212-E04]|nr:hypothetical protein AYO41_03815 [Verrucomicrobia bacterium SCGC AG-212-E04]